MNRPADARRAGRLRMAAAAAAVAAIAVLLFILIGRQEERTSPIPEPPRPDTSVSPGIDTAVAVLAEPPRPDTQTAGIKKKVQRRIQVARPDTIARTIVPAIGETAAVAITPRSDPCERDTTALWVYPEPSGGLHHGPVTMRFHATKPCVISWQRSTDTAWLIYHGDELRIDTSVAVLFNAVDSCGNEMPTREELYEIAQAKKTDECPSDMELVKIGAMRFCIDRFEWPNRKGALPVAYVSLYQAEDSCFSRNKRLCTSEEWSLACSGPYSWNFPYGQNYEIHACVTSDTAPRPSGMRSECRAYFGVFDMSGNLAEWTSTPAKENRAFNNVMGGFWESGPRSGCREVRYSYFPQNRHNPVGFRCCADAAGSGGGTGTP